MGIGNAITIGGVALGYITTKICAKLQHFIFRRKMFGIINPLKNKEEDKED